MTDHAIDSNGPVYGFGIVRDVLAANAVNPLSAQFPVFTPEATTEVCQLVWRIHELKECFNNLGSSEHQLLPKLLEGEVAEGAAITRNEAEGAEEPVQLIVVSVARMNGFAGDHCF